MCQTGSRRHQRQWLLGHTATLNGVVAEVTGQVGSRNGGYSTDVVLP